MSQNTELKAQAKKPGLNKKGIAAWINNYSFILIALAIFIAYLFINHGATTWSGVMNILRHSAVVGIMAFGMGLVIITGGIDLSVGSMLVGLSMMRISASVVSHRPRITFCWLPPDSDRIRSSWLLALMFSISRILLYCATSFRPRISW